MNLSKIFKTKTLGYSIACLTLPALISCGVFNESNKYVVNGQGVEVVKGSKPASTPQAEIKDSSSKQASSSTKQTKTTTSKKQKGKKNDTKHSASKNPQQSQREQVDGKTETKTQNSVGAASILPSGFSLDGEWTIYKVRNNIVTGEERPYICFDLKASKLYGSNGCNYINADISTDRAGHLTLGDIASTMKSCTDAPYEYLINLALSEVTNYSAEQQGSDTYLNLRAKNGSTLITLRRHNMEFLNGPWLVTTLNGSAMPPEGAEDAATFVVDIPQLKIHGNTGCNILNGNLYIDPDKPRSMQFLNIATTRMACAPNSRQTELLLALEACESAEEIGNGKVALLDSAGKQIMTLQRINYSELNDY